MDLSSDYYSYVDVKGKSIDTIFRELCSNDVYRQIEDGTWKEILINRFGEMLAETPNIRTTANRMLHNELLKRGYNVDPEKVYYNIFSDYTRVGEKIYHEFKTLTSSYRLTDAALMNLFKKDYDGSFYILQHWRRAGIYNIGKNGSVDPTNPNLGKCWGPHNAAFLAYEPADILEKSAGIQAEFTKDYNAYWTKYSDMYRDMLSDFFLMAAIKQYKAGLLSEYGFAMTRKVYAKQDGVTTYWFNINTYKANDIIVMESKATGMNHTILYIPGSMTPFIEFDNVTQMKKWLVNQLEDTKAMIAFLKHFSIYNRQDGPSYTGVDNIVRRMAERDSNWDPQYYILRDPEKIPYDRVFNKVRDQIKAQMHNDAQKLVTTNAEIYRDYALGFVETLLIYTSFLDFIMPEAFIPFNILLSFTALGLSSDIAINGDSLEKRMDGVGSLANSVINIASNMLPIFKDAGKVLKNFRRTASQIPAFANEEQFIMNTFHIDSKAALNNIQPGNTPIIIAHETGELRLVRLADGGKPLAVLRRASGNKFARLNPKTLKELESERLISEALSDGSSGRIVYLSGSTIQGGAPYNPFDHFFDEVWTLNELKRKADNLGMGDTKYTAIKQKLGEMHAATDFDTKQLAAHQLLFQLAEYKRTYPSALRNSVLNELGVQIKEILYPAEIKYLAKRLIESKAGMHPLVASRIYKVSVAERLGEVPDGVTWGLIKYAQDNPVLSISKFSEAAQMAIPTDINFPVKYTISDTAIMNKLDVDYTLLPEYASQGFTHNENVFEYALNESHKMGLLTKWLIKRTGPYGITRTSFIGYSYDEMLSMINEFSSSAKTRFGTHAHTVVRMLQNLLEVKGEGELMKRFGRIDYFDNIVKERLSNVEKNIRLYDSTAFQRFDISVDKVFEPHFNKLTSNAARLEKMMKSPNGIVMRNGPDEISFCLQNLDYFKENGITHIGLTNLFTDVHQAELDKFMEGGFLTPTLEAMILSTDKGVTDGPLYQLLVAARGKGLKVVALGNSDTALHSMVDAIKNAYHQSVVTRNANVLLGGKKSIVLTDMKMINTTPGLSVPTYGMAQALNAPGFYYQPSSRSMRYYPDLATNRAPIFIWLDRDWTSLAPSSGRFLGWRKYGDGFSPITPAQRRATVYAKIDHDLPGFQREYESIYKLVAPLACRENRRCDEISGKVNNALRRAGKRVGTGRSLSWWHPGGNSFVSSSHTASTVYIQDVEYVVDATHRQFYHHNLDEDVMIMTPDDWAEEILNRVKAYNPFIADRMHAGHTLWVFEGPDFTRPKMRKQNQ